MKQGLKLDAPLSLSEQIAESFGRKRYRGEYVQFLTYALVCDETKYHLEILYETLSFKKKDLSILQKIQRTGWQNL